jgi:hypothetical protein
VGTGHRLGRRGLGQGGGFGPHPLSEGDNQLKSEQAYNSDEERYSLTEAGSAALLAQANMRMVLADIGAELAAISEEAKARGEGQIALHELGRVWLLVRCGQILAGMEDEPAVDLPAEPITGRNAGWWGEAIRQ